MPKVKTAQLHVMPYACYRRSDKQGCLANKRPDYAPAQYPPPPSPFPFLWQSSLHRVPFQGLWLSHPANPFSWLLFRMNFSFPCLCLYVFIVLRICGCIFKAGQRASFCFSLSCPFSPVRALPSAFFFFSPPVIYLYPPNAAPAMAVTIMAGLSHFLFFSQKPCFLFVSPEVSPDELSPELLPLDESVVAGVCRMP